GVARLVRGRARARSRQGLGPARCVPRGHARARAPSRARGRRALRGRRGARAALAARRPAAGTSRGRAPLRARVLPPEWRRAPLEAGGGWPSAVVARGAVRGEHVAPLALATRRPARAARGSGRLGLERLPRVERARVSGVAHRERGAALVGVVLVLLTI